MKIKFIITALIGLLISTTSCAKKTETTTSMEENKDSKILVAYFSATGTTKHVAEELAQVMDATLFEITPETPYTSADLDWRNENSRSSVEMHDATSRPAIKDKVKDIEKYDVVFIGYPIWWYVAPTIINTFIDENNLSGKRIISFATSGGSPIEPCIEALQKQYPNLDWDGGKLLNHTSVKELNIWKEQLGL